MRKTIVVALLVLLAGCASGAEVSEDAARAAAAEDFGELCASCHGTFAEGGVAPALVPWGRGREPLVEAIDARMPPGDPTHCQGECAEDLADLILGGFDTGGGDCGTAGAPERSIRLLNRREYSATIRDMFSAQARTCSRDADCDRHAESCGAGVCSPLPCGQVRFTFDPGRVVGSVHVAGSFNGWPAQSGSGSAMQWSDEFGAFVGVFDVGRGTHQYKFVIDNADWVVDSANPRREGDGFGGENSIVDVTCDGTAPGSNPFDRDWGANLPVESRPEGFAFDNNADSGVVSSLHVDEHLRVAMEVGLLARDHVDTIVPCDFRSDADSCADQFVRAFGLTAFRRPLTDAERGRYVGTLRAQPSFEDGVALVIETMLASPNFLYRTELGADEDGAPRLTDYEIASAMSYGLWGSGPDAQLLAAAARGELAGAEGRQTQARRMLDDPRARLMVERFAVQWLGVEPIASITKSGVMYPDFGGDLRDAMLDETRRFVSHVVFDSTGRFDELLLADYTIADPLLANLYDLPIEGDRIAYAGRRSGLLGHASVLATYAHSEQSSPIRRGLFVRRNLLCQTFPPPPANAATIPDVDPNATTRERFRQHSADPSCNSCHRFIDEVGFGFEHFDAIGAWRDDENGLQIDGTGVVQGIEGLQSGVDAAFSDLPALAAILANADSAKSCFARQYFRFAHGRAETAADACAIERLAGHLAQSDGDIREMIIATYAAPDFDLRR